MDFQAGTEGQGYDDHHARATTAFNAETSTPRLIKTQRETESTSHQDKNRNHHFPEDLLIEILYRLPVKSIYRSKCVSKRWLYILSDPSFLLRYNISRFHGDPLPWTLYFRLVHGGRLKDIPEEYVGVHYVTSKDSAFKSQGFPLPFTSSSPQQHHLPEYFEVRASSNDLLLFHGCIKWPLLYFVSNPFTKQWIALPPSRHYRTKGVGFISQVKNGVTHYKVVLIVGVSHECDVFHLETFSSETGEWRKSEVSLPQPLNLGSSFHVAAIPYNGILHWIEHRLGIIIAYDPDNGDNRCSFIEMPKDRVNSHMNGLNAVLKVCQGCLRYFEMENICSRPRHFRAWKSWVLKDYDKGEWCLEHSAVERQICSFDAHPAIHEPLSAIIPIDFHPFDLDIIYFWCKLGYILSYNLRTGWFEPEFYRTPATAFMCSWLVFQIVRPPCPIPVSQPSWNTNFE